MGPVCLPESNSNISLVLFWRNSHKEMEIKIISIRIKYRNQTFDEWCFNNSCSKKCKFESDVLISTQKRTTTTNSITGSRDMLKMFSCFCETVVSRFFYRYFLFVYFFCKENLWIASDLLQLWSHFIIFELRE